LIGKLVGSVVPTIVVDPMDAVVPMDAVDPMDAFVPMVDVVPMDAVVPMDVVVPIVVVARIPFEFSRHPWLWMPASPTLWNASLTCIFVKQG
jgi:hypothetical protein